MLPSICSRCIFIRQISSTRTYCSKIAPNVNPPSSTNPSGLNLESKGLQTVVKRLVPMFDRVLVQKAEALQKTEGGIVLPEKSQKKVLTGTVVAVGPGNRNQNGEIVPIQVAVGDKVLLPEYGGTKVEMEANKEYYLFRESDILAKLEM